MSSRHNKATVEEACQFLSMMASNPYPGSIGFPWYPHWIGCTCPMHWALHVEISPEALGLARRAWNQPCKTTPETNRAQLEAANAEALLRTGWRP